MSKLYYIAKVTPDKNKLKELPDGFRKYVEDKGLYQDKSFTVLLKPLTIRQYRKYDDSRYSFDVLIYLLNNHIFPEKEVDKKLILDWSYLTKRIVDLLFSVSGEQIETIRANPEIMFEELRKRREGRGKIDYLLDLMVLSHMDMEWYERFQNMDLYDRYNLVSLIETQTGVTLEDRYKISVKSGAPIDLRAGNKRFMQRVRQAGFDENIDSMLEQTKEMLSEQMERDRKLAELGIKRKINTEEENREFGKLDRDI